MFSQSISNEEYARIAKDTPFANLTFDGELLRKQSNGTLRTYMANIELQEWSRLLYKRLKEVEVSFVLASYYFERGIPDEPYFVSPGPQGESVQYFPNMTEEHFRVKWMFDFHSDTFFYKMFSSLDTIGHILVKMFDIPTKGYIYFKKIVDKLPDALKVLKDVLTQIKESQEFLDADRIRNDSTHNFPASRVTSGVTLSESRGSLGVGKYTHAAEMHQIMRTSMSLVFDVVEALKTHIPHPDR